MKAHATAKETCRFPLKGSFEGDTGPCKGLYKAYEAVLGVLGGSWDLVLLGTVLTTLPVNGLSPIRPVREPIRLVVSPVTSSY